MSRLKIRLSQSNLAGVGVWAELGKNNKLNRGQAQLKLYPAQIINYLPQPNTTQSVPPSPVNPNYQQPL